MDRFIHHKGVAAPILHNNIDTDIIIPSRKMSCISKDGLGEYLFSGWRYTNINQRIINPNFILNKEEYANATILLSGVNFGCGSSREHAVWALKDFGIRVIIASSFGEIFYNNCICNGVLPIILSENIIKEIVKTQLLVPIPNNEPQRFLLNIQLPTQQVILCSGKSYRFSIKRGVKKILSEGLDPITMTSKYLDKINSFQKHYYDSHPWLKTDKSLQQIRQDA